MKKVLLTTLAATGLVLGTQQSQAVTFDAAWTYRDADLVNATVAAGSLLVPTASPLFTFNIVSLEAGDNSFTVQAPFGPSQSAGDTFTSAVNYVPNTPISEAIMDFWFSNTEGDNFVVTVPGQSIQTFNAGPVSFKSDLLNATVIVDLQTDGLLTYQVLNYGPSDLKLNYAALGANVFPPTNTPDGGATAMLLGLGSIGLGLIRRKLS